MATNHELIHCLYEAPTMEGGWRLFLEMLGSELGGAVTVLLAYDRKHRVANANCIAGISPEGLQQYVSHYAGLNPWMSPAHERVFLDGRVHLGEELVSLEDLKKTEFFQDFGRKQGIVHSMGLVSLQPGAALIPVLGANRGESGGEFAAAEVRLLEELGRHVHRVLEWEAREMEYRRLQDVFQDLPDATWELDADGIVRRANGKALEALGREGVVRLRKGVLQYRGARGFEPVKELIGRGVEGVMVADGYLQVRPMRSGGYLVVYREAGPSGGAGMRAIREAFGLSEAEMRLLGQLVEGGGLKAVAERLGISVNTAKTQLGALFAKTGTRRQAELVSLVSRVR